MNLLQELRLQCDELNREHFEMMKISNAQFNLIKRKTDEIIGTAL